MYVVRDAKEIKPTFKEWRAHHPFPLGSETTGVKQIETQTTLRTIDPNSKLRTLQLQGCRRRAALRKDC
jgi:hypothetical protein